MMKIQDVFKNFLKCSVAPKLREVGLSGSGQHYSIKSNTHWALLGIQKSVSSNSEQLKFTMNIFVVKKDEWDALRAERSFLPKKPTANTRHGIGWHERIGFLMPNQSDYWWSLDAETNLDELATNIVNLISTVVAPAIVEKIEST